jgi:exonuclease SbcC
MRIEKLLVKDFRSHKFTRVTFTGGINLIVGQNGSGKSSLLDALLVGLYWPTKPKDLRKEDILRIRGSDADKTSTEITVFFEKGGVRYQVHRKITRGVAYIKYLDGDTWRALESGQKGVRDWIEKTIPYDVFLNAIYIRQGEIDAILESDESRDKVVRQVLGLDKYENAYRNLLDVRKEIEGRIRSIEDYLKSTENLDDLISSMEKELSETLREIGELSSEIPELTKKLQKAEEELKRLDSLEKEINSLMLTIKKKEGNLNALEARRLELKERITEARERIKALEKKVEELKGLKDKAEEYTRLSEFRKHYVDGKARNEKLMAEYRAQISGIDERLKELEGLKKRLGELTGREEELEKKAKKLEEDVKAYEEAKSLTSSLERLRKRLKLKPEEVEELERSVDEARDRKEEIQREFETIKEKRGELKNLAKERNGAILELRKARGKCPVCGRELTEKHKEDIIKRYQEELKEVAARVKELDERERALRKELVRVEEVLKREKELIAARELLKQIEEIEGKLNRYNLESLEKRAKEHEMLKGELEKLKGEMAGIQRELERESTLLKKKDTLNKKLKKAEEELLRLNEELESLGFSNIKGLDSRIKGLEPAYQRYLELKSSPAELEKERKALEKFRRDMEGLVKKLKDEDRELNSLRKELEEKRGAYDPEKHAEARKHFIGLKEELATKNAELEGARKKHDEIMGRLKEFKEERRERERKLLDLQKLKKARERVQELREKVRRYKAMLREDALAKVGDVASKIFEELTEEKYSGITVKAEENKVKLGVVYSGREHGLGFLSGGERIALGLAFRLALSLYLAGEISLLILDEPTPYLDEERRRRLVDIMSRYLRKIPQVIVVSHDEELKDAADRVIKVSLENGVSVVREVELGV